MEVEATFFFFFGELKLIWSLTTVRQALRYIELAFTVAYIFLSFHNDQLKNVYSENWLMIRTPRFEKCGLSVAFLLILRFVRLGQTFFFFHF